MDEPARELNKHSGSKASKQTASHGREATKLKGCNLLRGTSMQLPLQEKIHLLPIYVYKTSLFILMPVHF